VPQFCYIKARPYGYLKARQRRAEPQPHTTSCTHNFGNYKTISRVPLTSTILLCPSVGWAVVLCCGKHVWNNGNYLTNLDNSKSVSDFGIDFPSTRKGAVIV
jgi:hypothetical protein